MKIIFTLIILLLLCFNIYASGPDLNEYFYKNNYTYSFSMMGSYSFPDDSYMKQAYIGTTASIGYFLFDFFTIQGDLRFGYQYYSYNNYIEENYSVSPQIGLTYYINLENLYPFISYSFGDYINFRYDDSTSHNFNNTFRIGLLNQIKDEFYLNFYISYIRVYHYRDYYIFADNMIQFGIGISRYIINK